MISRLPDDDLPGAFDDRGPRATGHIERWHATLYQDRTRLIRCAPALQVRETLAEPGLG